MVNAALSIGAATGVLLSAGFVYWEVGRYAAPQVPESRFDERKEILAYTAGLFAGIPFVIPLLFLFQSIPLLEIGGIALYLGALVGGTEIAQWLLLRSRYFGGDGAGPFYALGFRAGMGGILALALMTQYFALPTLEVPGLLAVLAACFGIVLLEGVGAILALPRRPVEPGRRGGPWSALPLEAVGFFMIGYTAGFGSWTGVAGGAVVAVGAAMLYRSLAPESLARVSLTGREPSDASADEAERPFGRTDR
ncbi:MAG TPA: hypothetical protein VMH90_00900 [Thermoplasmata archaeon]|nr:hypothetical protein [Thermoplasmata archaeon]